MEKLKKIEQLRKKLKNNKVSIGTWMQIPNSSVAEILGSLNLDWIVIDIEHGSFSLSRLPDIFRAIELGEKIPLVRIPSSDFTFANQVLDAGAMGLIIPNIKNKEFRNISKSKQKNIYWINFVERKNGKRHQEFYQIREKDFKIKKLSFEKMNKFMSAKSKHFDNFAIVYGNEGLAIINYVKKNIAKNGYTILSKIKNNKETIYNFGTETSYIGEKFNIKNQFEYNQNNFKFFVSATNFIDEKKNKFRHTLKNYDEFSNFSKD